MKANTTIVLIVSAASVVAALFYCLPPPPVLPHSPLRGGGEFRVVQITYSDKASDDTDHNIGAARRRLWLYWHLPAALRQRVPVPSRGIGYQASRGPVLSIWWAHFDPANHKPILGEAGDVLMTVDSGQQTNLGWPKPAEDYRQIFVTDPPRDSKRLTFEFPIWGERVRFSIDNPAYRH